MKKRIVTLMLAFALLLPCGVAAAAGSYEDFTDLKTDAWYRESIKFMLENGYMDGMSETEFAPTLYLTRAQAVTVLWRCDGSRKVSAEGELPFEDVKEGSWYGDAVKWAYYSCLTDGVSENEFGTEQNVSREQLIVWLYRLNSPLPGNGDHLSAFSDAGDISEYAKPAMNWAVSKGIIDGEGDRLLPKSFATRAQAAAIISRYIKVSTAVPVPTTPAKER